MWKSLRQRGLKNKKFFQISVREKLLLGIKSILAVLLINYCFYQNFLAFFPLLIFGWLYFKREQKEILHKKREEARQQFKEMLLLAVAGQKAGYSVENAFLNSYGDMANLYGADSSICRMLTEIKAGLDNNLNIAGLWKNIGEACDITEIKEFSEVFCIAKESGGNMTAIMDRTAETIGDKAETQKEIETLLSERKLEQKIMNVMPFLLMIYISFTSPGYFNGLYHSAEGIVIMTFCLFFYLAAYAIGIKIISVEI